MQGKHFLQDAVDQFHQQKKLADAAIVQVCAAELFSQLDQESNSIALVMKHMSGNMRSRWTEFLISDGEKPDRNRDSEFVIEPGDTLESLLARWEAGWRCLFSTLESLGPEDVDKTVLIRTEPHSVMSVITRQLTHYAYHIGQIVFLTKHFAGPKWRSLSIPRGKSQEFNAKRGVK